MYLEFKNLKDLIYYNSVFAFTPLKEIIALWCQLHSALYQENLNVHSWMIFSLWHYSRLRFNWTEIYIYYGIIPDSGLTGPKYIYIYIYIYKHIYIYIYKQTYIYIYIYIYIQAYIYIYIYIYISEKKRVQKFISTIVHMYTHKHTRIYTYTNIYTLSHTHIYSHTGLSLSLYIYIYIYKCWGQMCYRKL